LALELGMQRFLEQLQHLVPSQSRHRGGAGLWPWVVAVATAAAATGAACEIVRREARRSAAVPVAGREPDADSPPDQPLEG
jgi:hypothetical protein